MRKTYVYTELELSLLFYSNKLEKRQLNFESTTCIFNKLIFLVFSFQNASSSRFSRRKRSQSIYSCFASRFSRERVQNTSRTCAEEWGKYVPLHHPFSENIFNLHVFAERHYYATLPPLPPPHNAHLISRLKCLKFLYKNNSGTPRNWKPLRKLSYKLEWYPLCDIIQLSGKWRSPEKYD